MNKDELSTIISKLGQRPIAFIPAYADLPGCNVNAALLLSQMVYWADKGRLQDGWIYKGAKSGRKRLVLVCGRLTRRVLLSIRQELLNSGSPVCQPSYRAASISRGKRSCCF
jgi:hypothetical protein